MTVKQRSTLWRQMRLGDVTASRFGDVLTSASATGIFEIRGIRGDWSVYENGQLASGSFDRKSDAEEHKRGMVDEWRKTHWSATAESYLNELLAELVNCQPSDTWRSDATDWGTENEPFAFEAAVPVIAKRYGDWLDLPVDDMAYIHHPTEPGIGCSPDGIIGDEGLAEIKCYFNPSKWIRVKREGLTLPGEHRAQVMGQLWVTGRKWCALCVYDPRVVSSGLDPLITTKIERDDEYINNTLAPRVCAFRDYLRSEYERLTQGQKPF